MKSGPAKSILVNRVKHRDASRAVQARRLKVSYGTLRDSELVDRWPIGAAGKLLRAALGVKERA